MNKVAVIGAGSWGTALSIVLSDNGYQVSLYARRKEQADEINEQHANRNYLPDVHLPQTIRATSSLREALWDTNTILLVLPTSSIRSVLQEMKPWVGPETIFIHSSKGLEPNTYKRVSQMIEEETGDLEIRGIVALSGPSHAEEVSLRSPTTVVASSEKEYLAKEVQDVLINPQFRVYTNPDLIGVELGGALKNIIALGTGLSDGLGYGDNAKAALMTRGLTEISRLGTALGAHPLTFAGLAGIGDLIVTCTSQHSRNWRCGYAIGRGDSLEDVLQKMGMVVEGVRTTKAAYQISKHCQVDMPITEQLHQVLFENKPPRQAVDDLMQRGKTHELEMSDMGDLQNMKRYF